MSHFQKEGQSLQLFAPGPVQVPDFILEELSKPNETHRTKSYQELHSQVRSKMQSLLHTGNDILFFTCSGTGVMEACIRNLVGKWSKALILSCGNFGERFAQIVETCNKKVRTIQFAWGKSFTKEHVKEIMDEDTYDVVFMTMNESSTGVMNPVWDIGKVVHQKGALFVVDAVSCMAGFEIKVDEWNIDVCFASTQKCFGVPPGLSVCSVSEKALNYCKHVKDRGWYFDFIRMSESSKKDYTPATPNINLLRALNTTLDIILYDETPARRYSRHAELTSTIQNWAIQNGFELFAEKGFESPTITVVKNTRNIDVQKVIEMMIEKGYLFANGYGCLAQKTFRLAAMGWHSKEKLQGFLDTLQECITNQ